MCNSFLSKKVQILAAGAFKNKLCLPSRGFFFFFFFANDECARFCVCFSVRALFFCAKTVVTS